MADDIREVTYLHLAPELLSSQPVQEVLGETCPQLDSLGLFSADCLQRKLASSCTG